jgi:broad specificity phosphatase PhoE
MFNRQPAETLRLFLARHGESEANQQKLVTGQLDVPLSDKGRSQAQWLCDVLKDEPLTAIYSSSLSRAMATAQPTADFHQLELHALDDLKEIHFGSLQGKAANDSGLETKPSLQRKQMDKVITVSDGESFQAFETRVWNCFEKLLKNMLGNSLVVAHRNTNEVILKRLLGFSHKSRRTINVKNKYLYEIQMTATPTINTIRLGGEFHGKKFAGLKDD